MAPGAAAMLWVDLIGPAAPRVDVAHIREDWTTIKVKHARRNTSRFSLRDQRRRGFWPPTHSARERLESLIVTARQTDGTDHDLGLPRLFARLVDHGATATSVRKSTWLQPAHRRQSPDIAH